MKGLSREQGLEGRHFARTGKRRVTHGRQGCPTNVTLKLPLSERGISLEWGPQIYLWMPQLHPNCSGRKDRHISKAP